MVWDFLGFFETRSGIILCPASGNPGEKRVEREANVKYVLSKRALILPVRRTGTAGKVTDFVAAHTRRI